MNIPSVPVWNFAGQGLSSIPRVRVNGTPHERGYMFGEAAAERIALSRKKYAEVYLQNASLTWKRARLEAEQFLKPIRDFNDAYVEEMQGMADGSKLDLLDILAMNLRTEFLFAAKVREKSRSTIATGECTSFAYVNPDSHVVAGQNWDWLTFSEDTIVLLEVEQDDGPNFVTIVEAGLLAKFGMNSAGLVTLTNALCSSRDQARPGVPYHVMLRSLLDAESPLDWITTLQRANRASSANYLLATADGIALNAETIPGGFDNIFWSSPNEHGLISHANHFLKSNLPDGVLDVGSLTMADSLFRLQRFQHVSRTNSHAHPKDMEDPLDRWKAVLSDHAGYPDSICCHPNPTAPEIERWRTSVGVIFEPSTFRAEIHVGNPCQNNWQHLSYSM